MNFQLVVVASVGIALGVAGVAQGSEDVLSRCCALGSDWARQRSYSGCADFPAPVTSVPGEQLAMCIASADICCRRDNRKIQCKRGTGAAQSNKSCAVNVTEHGEAYKDCCEACKLGMIARALGESCGMRRFAFGLPWDGAFHECCQDADGPPTPTQSNLLTPVLNFTHCDEGTCSHICVPTLGSFRCECHPGFSLMSDRKSCQLQTDQDRCVRNNPCMHRCRDTGLAVECSCNPGYELQKDGKTCSDINECERGNTLCPKSTTCHNFPGGYTCVGREGPVIPVFDAPLDNALPLSAPSSAGLGLCPVGWDWDPKNKVCDDVDECGQGLANCPRPEDCVNTLGSFSCDGLVSCPPGYVRDPAQGCVDKDECDDGSNSCDEDSEFCINQQGGYDCLERTQGRGSCPAGYKKDATHKSGCTDVNECLEQIHNCQPDTEVCRNTPGAYDCDLRCDIGFRLNPTTRTCQDVDECVELGRSPCSASERCVNMPGSYLCVPTAQPRAETATPGSDRVAMKPGVCPKGFKIGSSVGLCDDVNECQEGTHTCRQDEVCVNEVGGFRCESRASKTPSTSTTPSPSCPQGYQFSRQQRDCIDVDECALAMHNCSPSEKCVNVEGAFVCSPACEPGFRVRTGNVCEDIDECAEGLHSCLIASQRCHNTNGSFTCEDSPPCPTGYFKTPSGGCDDFNECLEGSSSCGTDLCINTPGSFRCIATTTPRTTTRQTPPPTTTTTDVTCNAGFRFSARSRQCLDVDECADPNLHVCSNVTEECVNHKGGYRCIRKEGAGPSVAPGPSPVPSRCQTGFIYSLGQKKCVDDDECVRSPCDSNQRCHNTLGSYSCECKDGYVRDPITMACVDVNECQLGLDNCMETQRCDNTIGSFQCIRFSGCGTGYTLNAATGLCEDDDECLLGNDNCAESGPTWVCRNTQGSFRCEQKHCDDGHVLLSSGECVRVECDPGFRPAPASADCVDIDECTVASPCGRGQRCVNTPGSYQCVYRIQCKPGYVPSPEGDRCVDEDECATGSHKCRPGQTCLNRPGSYQCQCPPGHTLDADKKCVDVDECERFPRQACSDLATCENTIGSYRCVCKDGFKQGRGKSCDDIDECAETPNLCQHQCINVWGSYRCSCERGFHLHSDNRSCVDIDECQVHREGRLCVGDCVNTPGSYKCVCPSGYRLGKDGRTCIDIDECSTGRECRRPGEVCLNMQGSFRCNNIRCPEGYQQDFTQKNRCRRVARACPIEDQECRRQPLLMTYNFMSLVSNMNIPPSGQLDLFVMKGSLTSDTHTTFSLELDSARTPHGVPAATSSHFRLTQVKDNQAVVSLVRPLAGPQDVELRLVMEVYSGSYFAGLNVAKLNLFVSQNQF